MYTNYISQQLLLSALSFRGPERVCILREDEENTFCMWDQKEVHVDRVAREPLEVWLTR